MNSFRLASMKIDDGLKTAYKNDVTVFCFNLNKTPSCHTLSKAFVMPKETDLT